MYADPAYGDSIFFDANGKLRIKFHPTAFIHVNSGASTAGILK